MELFIRKTIRRLQSKVVVWLLKELVFEMKKIVLKAVHQFLK